MKRMFVLALATAGVLAAGSSALAGATHHRAHAGVRADAGYCADPAHCPGYPCTGASASATGDHTRMDASGSCPGVDPSKCPAGCRARGAASASAKHAPAKVAKRPAASVTAVKI